MTDKGKDVLSAAPVLRDFMPERPFAANTGRRWKLYDICLKLREITNWDGKVILDVGSSYKPSFDDKVAQRFPGAKVIAVDPTFIINGKGAYPIEQYDQYQLKNMSVDYDPDTERRIGVVQELPVEDHSVDEVWSLVAVPVHLPVDHQGRMWAEMLRVLKPGGEVRLAPTGSKIDHFFAQLLRQYGYEVEEYTLDHGDKFIPNRGIVVRIPKMSVEEVHELAEAFKHYLITANIYATGNEWKTSYFWNEYGKELNVIPAPIPKAVSSE